MQTRNYILFLVLSMGILIGWESFVAPRLFPRKPVAKNDAKNDLKQADSPNPPIADNKGKKADDQAKVAAKDGDKNGEKAGAKDAGKKAKEKPAVVAAKEPAAGAKPPAVPVFEHKSVKIGSLDPATGYFLEAEIDSKGASLASLKLNDPRYRELKDPKVPLNLVGNDINLRLPALIEDLKSAQTERDSAAQLVKEVEASAQTKDPTAVAELEHDRTALQTAEENLRRAERNYTLAQRTFNTDVPEIDAAFAANEKNVAGREWSVAEVTADPAHAGVNSAVTFSYPSPDGQFVVQKRYSLVAVPGAGDSDGSSPQARLLRDTDTSGYLLHLDITLKNQSPAQRTASYLLQGPVGVPLENADNTRKFRDLKMGFLLPDGAINSTSKTAATVISDQQKNKDQEWKAPVRYIGVDVQYFAALVVPVDEQLKDPTVERSIPMVLDHPTNQSLTDISVQLESKPIVMPPKQSVTQHYELYAGPKRKELLTAIQAEGILDTSWFSPPIVSHVMLGLLNFFHGLGLPYGIAIICLTICVRACIFPLSLRQTAQAARMKEMQPRIEELKKKYGADKEGFAKAQMQLWREHKINPLGGCLPLFIQLPIFTGLWMAVNSSVDLRLAPFLYIKNLAAPDALFHLGFTLPFLGWTDFNLLPFITVALFVVQQKMFMPPPTDEQQAMQYKMMNVMTVVMGVMFYRVPAGLCVYFISSSLWGVGERKLLEYWKKKHPQKAVTPDSSTAEGEKHALASIPGNKVAARAGEAAGSFWKKLLDAADSAGAEGMSGSKTTTTRRKDFSGGKKNGKRRG